MPGSILGTAPPVCTSSQTACGHAAPSSPATRPSRRFWGAPSAAHAASTARMSSRNVNWMLWGGLSGGARVRCTLLDIGVICRVGTNGNQIVEKKTQIKKAKQARA